MANMDDKGPNYVALASTNKAAKVIKGMTIHRFVISYCEKNIRDLKLDHIIVDEVSMLQKTFNKFCARLVRHSRQLDLLCQVISIN